jgi:hypothetical protein
MTLVCPKIQKFNDFIIPLDTEIHPFPIRLDNDDSDVIINVYGLPDGMSYDNVNRLICGKPKSMGRHGVIISAVNKSEFDISGFKIDVINYNRLVATMKPIDHQTVQLGAPIEPILVEVDDSSAEIIATGLPNGVEYDPFINRIHGTPDTPGHYKVTVRAINKYNTESIVRFMINVEGVINPAIELIITSEEAIVDGKYHFHSVDDQIIYSFTVKNTGNVPLKNIQLKDTKLGNIISKTQIGSNECAKFKYQYHITANDLNRGSININTVASGETMSGIKLMTLPVLNTIDIRGHDDSSLYAKIIKFDNSSKDIKYTLMVANCGYNPVCELKIHDTRGDDVLLDKNKINVGECIFPTILCKTKYTDTEQMFTIVGKLPSGTLIGNKYHFTHEAGNKNMVSLQLYSNHYYVKEPHNNIVFVAQLSVIRKNTNSPPITGIIKFYDGIKCLGKAGIYGSISLLTISDVHLGMHNIYAVYQGDDNHLENGSNIVTEFIGDEKSFTNEQLLYIKNHLDKFKKNEYIANTLTKQYKQK